MADFLINSGLATIEDVWTAVTSSAVARELPIQWCEDVEKYRIFTIDNNVIYTTIIYKGTVPTDFYVDQATNDSNKVDFEANYKDVSPSRTKFEIAGSAHMVSHLYSSYSPDPTAIVTDVNANVSLDSIGRMEVHSTDTTDEGSFRSDFTGTSLSSSLTGLVTFTSGSTDVVGVGTSFTTEAAMYMFIKGEFCIEECYCEIESVNSDTSITLCDPYLQTFTTCSAFVTSWRTITPTSGSITVLNSTASVNAGHVSGSYGYICRIGDYGPCTLNGALAITQRIAGQTAVFGFMDDFVSPTKQAIVRFTGTNTSSIEFVSSFGSERSDTQVSTITLPMDASTSNISNFYKIDVSGNQTSLLVNGILVAVHNLHIPGPYDMLNVYMGITNTTAVTSSTSILIDSVYFYNMNRVQVDNDFSGEPLKVSSIVRPQYGLLNQRATITLASLSNNASRASTAINNAFTLYEDVYFTVRVTTHTSGISATGYVNVYGYGTVDGVTYPENITGVDAAVTLSSPPNLVLLAQLAANSNGKTFTAGPFSFCRMYGLDRLPQKWGFVVRNNTGAVLNATGSHSITYQGMNAALGTNTQTFV